METRHQSRNHKGFAFFSLLLLIALSYTWNGPQVAANPAASMALSGMAAGNTALAKSPSNLNSRVPSFAIKENLNGQSNGFRSRAAPDFTSSNLKLNSGWDTSLAPIKASWSQNAYDVTAQKSILADVAATYEMSPPDCYNNLLSRFNEWQHRFRKLTLTSSEMGNNPNPDSMIRQAFDLASKELEGEDCEDATGNFDAHSAGPNQDFVYKLFKKAIEIMDDFLDNFNQIKAQFQNLMELKDIMQDEIVPSPETRDRMIENIKTKTIQFAKKQLKIQLNKHATKIGVSFLSNILVNKFGYPDNPEDYLVPIAQALNSNTLNKVAEILSDIQFRGAIGLINSNNPMPFTKCKSRRDTQDLKC